MTIKLPKSYNACGAELTVLKKKPQFIYEEGSFNLADYEIAICPAMFKDDYNTVNTFLHETLESTLALMNCRFICKQTEPYMFIFNHSQFEQAVSQLARGVLGLVNENRKKH